MGLDMYLHRRIYPTSFEPEATTTFEAEEFKHITYINQEAFYWRKANHIHKWFVDNVQGGEDDCSEYTVSISQLEELLDKVNTVLESPKLAKDILPTQEGFFFGSLEYGPDYFEDLKNTKEGLEKVIAEERKFHKNRLVTLYYHSSW